jgi:hypothetical protein
MRRGATGRKEKGEGDLVGGAKAEGVLELVGTDKEVKSG